MTSGQNISGSTATATKRRNEIQFLRALAACEVVVCHSDLVVKYISPDRIILNDWYQPVAGSGVELFFIVSGYIMSMRMGAFHSYRDFIVSRISRIYPMYWLFTTIVVLVGLTMPAWQLGGSAPDLVAFARSYLIWPYWGFPILGVGWTLEYEMVFYVLVTLLMALKLPRGQGWFACLLAALAFIGCVLGPQTSGSAVRYHLFSPYMFAFGAGWLFRSIEQATWTTRIRIVGAFAAIVLLAAGVAGAWGDHLIFRISFAAMVFSGFLLARRVFQASNWFNRSIWLIGDGSFSIYLSHWFVLSAAGKLFGTLGVPASQASIARVLTILLSVAIGLGFYCLLEKPLDRRLRGRPGHRRPTRRSNVPVAAAIPVEVPVFSRRSR